VEEATSASQSMKEQAQALMGQVLSFKMTASGQGSQARSSVSTSGTVKKQGFKKPAAPLRAEAQRELASVASGNGKDRQQQDNEFEEF
jgi:hypothetical protein